MIYDKALVHMTLPAGTPLQAALQKQRIYFYADMTVYSKRFWDSVQAGSSVDRMAALPMHLSIDAGDYCQLEDDRIYRIEQVQHDADGDGLPRTVLSLHRTDMRYDYAGGEVT